MKKILWIVSLLAGSGVFGAQGAAALLKGEVKTYDMDGFRLHVYLTQDALGDATTVVEGRDGLVILEMPLFKENLKEFAGYLKGLGKPVVKVVADYHVGGVADYAPGQVVLVDFGRYPDYIVSSDVAQNAALIQQMLDASPIDALTFAE